MKAKYTFYKHLHVKFVFITVKSEVFAKMIGILGHNELIKTVLANTDIILMIFFKLKENFCNWAAKCGNGKSKQFLNMIRVWTM